MGRHWLPRNMRGLAGVMDVLLIVALAARVYTFVKIHQPVLILGEISDFSKVILLKSSTVFSTLFLVQESSEMFTYFCLHNFVKGKH